MPLGAGIGRDAADIAFTALGEVAAGFSSDPAGPRPSWPRPASKIDTRLARSVTANRFDGGDLGEGIGQAVSEVVPEHDRRHRRRRGRRGLQRRRQPPQAHGEHGQADRGAASSRAPRRWNSAPRACAGSMEALDRLDNALAYPSARRRGRWTCCGRRKPSAIKDGDPENRSYPPTQGLERRQTSATILCPVHAVGASRADGHNRGFPVCRGAPHG